MDSNESMFCAWQKKVLAVRAKTTGKNCLVKNCIIEEIEFANL
jgi:hypothetical protein